MKAQKSFLIAGICLFLGFIATISLAQQAPDDFPPEAVGAGVDLVVTSVSGPANAFLNQTITVTYNVKNQGDAASGAYQVGLYLSLDKTIDPANDRLLKNVTCSTGLAPGEIKTKRTEVVVPNYHVNGLSGKYYYGAVVGTSKKASSKQVSIVRYSLGDNNETVTDYKTDLIWQRADDEKGRNWAAAKQYCGELVLGGKADWRLPSIQELNTIVDYSQSNPSIDPKFSCSLGSYWSSSALNISTSGAWNVDFNDGYVDAHCKTGYGYYVRCVRGGP